jgi:hypothetical protein
VSGSWKHPPDWFVEGIGREIRRGVQLFQESQSGSDLVVESIRVRLFLGDQLCELVFDDGGECRGSLRISANSKRPGRVTGKL